MRNYKRKTNYGLTPKDVMLRAAKEVKLKNKSIRSVAKDFDIPHRTLTRFCSKVTEEEIHGNKTHPTTMLGFNATRQNMKKHLSYRTKELEDLTGEYDVLEMAFEKVKEERDDLHDKFVSAILELQQKSSMKNVVLERRLEVLSAALEQRDVQVAEVMAATNIDPKAMHSVNKKLEELLSSKNSQIEKLQLEVARVLKAHDDMVLSLEGKLKAMGISREEVGLHSSYKTRPPKCVYSSTST